MKHFMLAAIVCAVSAAAQISAPRIGIALDGQGALRPVTGVAGNLIAGEPVAGGVVSAAASNTAMVIKTATEIRVFDAGANLNSRVAAPAGPAFVAFSASGAPAFLWVAEKRQLLGWCGRMFCRAPLPMAAISGEVLAVGAADADHVDLAALRNGTVEILHVRTSDGAIAATTPLPGAIGSPLLIADGSVLYAVTGALVLRDRYGHERRTPFPHDTAAIVPMSSTWALVTTKQTRRFAVRLLDGAAFQIPEVQ